MTRASRALNWRRSVWVLCLLVLQASGESTDHQDVSVPSSSSADNQVEVPSKKHRRAQKVRWNPTSRTTLRTTTQRFHRRLATTDDATQSNSSNNHSECESDHGHQHDALLFLFNALLIGVAVMHVGCYYAGLQESVVLFVLGMMYSLVQEGLGFKDDSGVFGTSYDMWMGIDPHLLLFALLPVLLTGDAMTIDTNVAKVVAKQCLFLAGPGVLINAFATAGFLMLYLDWDFLLSLTTGSILCATDPVAVVALLKELGASPTLTVQIQGESLLNDGTAIVVYTIAYNMLSGVEYRTDELVLFLVKTAIMAFGLGALIGYVFFMWVQVANHLANHRSDMIQIALTLCCAYWSFIIAEGVLEISGVLSTVGAALVLAHNMWPHIKSKATMLHVWHTFEFLGNTVIFFLGGALVGNAMIDIDIADYLHLLVLYVFLTFARGVTIFACRPLLRILSEEREPVTKADAAVITWGGLRGAVGLALAIQVFNDRAEDEFGNPSIDEYEARRVLFFVGGIAFLTTIINAPTCPFLVSWLELTALPTARLKLLRMLHREMVEHSEHQNDLPAVVLHSVRHVLQETQNAIEVQATRQEKALAAKIKRGVQGGLQSTRLSMGWSRQQVNPHGHLRKSVSDQLQMEDYMKDVLMRFRCAKDEYASLKNTREESGGGFKSLWNVPKSPHAEDLESILLQGSPPLDKELSKVLNEAFMYLVRSQYYRLMEDGELQPGSKEAKLLLHSVQMGLSHLRDDINDYEYVARNLHRDEDQIGADRPSFVRKGLHGRGDGGLLQRKNMGWKRCLHARDWDEPPGPVERVCESTAFQVLVVAMLLINGFIMLVEEKISNQHETESQKPVWLYLDIVFTAVFLLEFGLKFGYQRFGYYLDGWNVFDFVLVTMGLLGVIVSIETTTSEAGEGDVSSEARLVRLSRVFRVMRLLRLFRLVKFIKTIRMKLRSVDYSPELASSLVTIQTLRFFMLAHVNSQIAFTKYFGSPDRSLEVCRLLIQSQTEVYAATCRAATEEMRIDPYTLPQMNLWLQSKDYTREMVNVVVSAHDLSVITGREAHTVIHPLEHHVLACRRSVWETVQGVQIRQKGSEASGDSTLNHQPSFMSYKDSPRDTVSGIGLKSPRTTTGTVENGSRGSECKVNGEPSPRMVAIPGVTAEEPTEQPDA